MRPGEIPKLIKAMLALACFTAVAVIIEYRFGTNVFHDYIGPLFPGYVRPEGIGTYDAIGRKLLYGPSVQPLAVAVMFSLALPFAFAWLLKAKERRERIIYGAVVLLLIGGAVATQKKTSMVGPLVCILVLCAYRPRAMVRLAPWLIVLVGVVHVFAPGAFGAVIDQFAPGSVTKVNTTRDRLSDYNAIKPDLADHLLIGRGYGSYNQKQHRILDNQYLTLGIGVGLIGVLAYLAIFVTSFFSAHRGRPLRRPRPGAARRSAPPRRSSSPWSPARCSTSSPSPSFPISSASSRRSPSSPGATTPRKLPPTDPRNAALREPARGPALRRCGLPRSCGR